MPPRKLIITRLSHLRPHPHPSTRSCILANQSNPTSCDPYKASLSSCAASAVPLMSRIKAQCKPAILSFDACINEANRRGLSDEQTNDLCGAKLRELWTCTEKAQRELKEEEGRQ